MAYRRNAWNVVDSNKILLYFLVWLFKTWTQCFSQCAFHWLSTLFLVSRSKLWRRALLKLYLWLLYIVVMGFPLTLDQNFRNFRNGCIWQGNRRILWMSKIRTIQAKIPEIPVTNSNETKIPGSKFSKIRIYTRAWPLFRKREDAQFLGPLEISGNSIRP